MEIDDDPF
nr:TPA_asm: m03.5 sORF [Murid betaherpesvirus 1]DBA07919.1 TPA_asm: m03.5 sORF [Murid betaherpesvirus 1]